MTRAARVVPDVASFAVDEGFWYSIPDHLANDLEVGSIVRVPLSGRRVRGWVVETADREDGKLKDVAAISGSTPVFDGRLIDSLLWAARHYVAPVSTLLSRATPPNLPRSIPEAPDVSSAGADDHPLHDLAVRSAGGVRSPVTAYLEPWYGSSWLGAVGPVLHAGKSVLVVVASRVEVDVVASEATRVWGHSVVSVSGEDDAADTTAWEGAQASARLVVGTPKTATWHIAELALAVVLEESRRAMKDRQTPTLHVRDVMATRSRLEGFNLAFIGPTPGVELLSSGAELVRIANRAWPLVEVVDRSEESVSDGFLSNRTTAALKATISGGGDAFVFAHRRVGFASARCANCRAQRSCVSCGRRIGRTDACPRCQTAAGTCLNCGGSEFEEMGTIPERLVTEINRKLGREVAKLAPANGPITVGTERDLVGSRQVGLAVAADADGMLVGSGYRTDEEALRQLARLATKVSSRRGSRMMVQTSRPDSLLIASLRRGDPLPYLERVLVERGRDGMPPARPMLALELRGEVPEGLEAEIPAPREGYEVLGPMQLDDGRRWLLTGDLAHAKARLRERVGRWRDKGAVVRIDVDPIDV